MTGTFKAQKLRVMTTKEAIEFLENRHLGVSMTAESPKGRGFKVNCTLSGGSKLVCTVIQFPDYNWTQYKKQPYIGPNMGDHLYFAFYHPDLPRLELVMAIY